LLALITDQLHERGYRGLGASNRRRVKRDFPSPRALAGGNEEIRVLCLATGFDEA